MNPQFDHLTLGDVEISNIDIELSFLLRERYDSSFDVTEFFDTDLDSSVSVDIEQEPVLID